MILRVQRMCSRVLEKERETADMDDFASATAKVMSGKTKYGIRKTHNNKKKKFSIRKRRIK